MAFRKFGDALTVMLSRVLARFGLVSRGKTFYVHYTVGQNGSVDGQTPEQPFKTLDPGKQLLSYQRRLLYTTSTAPLDAPPAENLKPSQMKLFTVTLPQNLPMVDSSGK